MTTRVKPTTAGDVARLIGTIPNPTGVLRTGLANTVIDNTDPIISPALTTARHAINDRLGRNARVKTDFELAGDPAQFTRLQRAMERAENPQARREW